MGGMRKARDARLTLKAYKTTAERSVQNEHLLSEGNLCWEESADETSRVKPSWTSRRSVGRLG